MVHDTHTPALCRLGSWSSTITRTSWSLLECARRNSPSTSSWSSFKVNVILLDSVFMSFSLSTQWPQRFIVSFSLLHFVPPSSLSFSLCTCVCVCCYTFQGGDFLSFLRSEGHSLTPKMLVKMTENVASGMEYLESKKCIHRSVNWSRCS